MGCARNDHWCAITVVTYALLPSSIPRRKNGDVPYYLDGMIIYYRYHWPQYANVFCFSGYQVASRCVPSLVWFSVRLFISYRHIAKTLRNLVIICRTVLCCHWLPYCVSVRWFVVSYSWLSGAWVFKHFFLSLKVSSLIVTLTRFQLFVRSTPSWLSCSELSCFHSF